MSRLTLPMFFDAVDSDAIRAVSWCADDSHIDFAVQTDSERLSLRMRSTPERLNAVLAFGSAVPLADNGATFVEVVSDPCPSKRVWQYVNAAHVTAYERCPPPKHELRLGPSKHVLAFSNADTREAFLDTLKQTRKLLGLPEAIDEAELRSRLAEPRQAGTAPMPTSLPRGQYRVRVDAAAARAFLCEQRIDIPAPQGPMGFVVRDTDGAVVLAVTACVDVHTSDKEVRLPLVRLTGIHSGSVAPAVVFLVAVSLAVELFVVRGLWRSACPDSVSELTLLTPAMAVDVAILPPSTIGALTEQAEALFGVPPSVSADFAAPATFDPTVCLLLTSDVVTLVGAMRASPRVQFLT